MSFKWSPLSKKQLQVLTWWIDNSPMKNKDGIIAEGAVRSGKTLLMSFSFICWSMNRHINENFGICGKTIASLERNLIKPLEEVLYSRGYSIKKNTGKNLLTIKKDGITNYYYMFGGKDESSQDLVQGITLNGCLLDEVALMPESFVNQVLARCSKEGSKFWFNCNPEGPKHWFRLNHLLEADKKNYLVLHFSLEDNPSLSEKTRNGYYSRFKGVFYERFILGKWVQATGVIYDSFDESKNTYSSDQLPIKCKEGDIPATYGSDFGTQNPQVYLEAYKVKIQGDPIPFLYIDREFYYSGRDAMVQKEPRQYVNDFAIFRNGRRYSSIIIDPSATPLIAAHRNAGDKITKAKNDVHEGIAKVHSLFQSGHILINKSGCHKLIGELGMYSWDSKKVDHGKEEPIKEFDHACDALRYIVNTTYSDYEVYGERIRK